MSVSVGFAIVNACERVVDPPPEFATVTSKTVPAAASLVGTEGTTASTLVAVEVDVITCASKLALPEVNVTVGDEMLDPEIWTIVLIVPVAGVTDVIPGPAGGDAEFLDDPLQPERASANVADERSTNTPVRIRVMHAS